MKNKREKELVKKGTNIKEQKTKRSNGLRFKGQAVADKPLLKVMMLKL